MALAALHERGAMSNNPDQKPAKKNVSVFMCGPSSGPCKCACATGGTCEHVWDGEEQEGECSGGGFFSTTTCSRCGMTAISHDMFVAP